MLNRLLPKPFEDAGDCRCHRSPVMPRKESAVANEDRPTVRAKAFIDLLLENIYLDLKQHYGDKPIPAQSFEVNTPKATIALTIVPQKAEEVPR